jgi:hypothetical protein
VAIGAGGEDGHAKFPFCILFFVLLSTALAGDAAGLACGKPLAAEGSGE